VTVALKTKNRTGPVSKKLQLTTNDPKRPNVNLLCKGTVRSVYRAEPMSAGFGVVTRLGGAQRQTIKVTSADAGPLKLELVPLEKPGVTTVLRTVKPGEEYELEVTLTPPLPEGRLRENLKLKTGFDHVPEIEIPIHAMIAPRVTTTPNLVSVPDDATSSVTRTLRLRWDDQTRPTILEAKADDPALTVRVEDQAGEQVVVVEAPAGFNPAANSAHVLIHTDDQIAPEVRVPVRVSRSKRPTPQGSGTARSRFTPRGALTGRAVRPKKDPPDKEAPAATDAGVQQPTPEKPAGDDSSSETP